jgi:hypothetical protein
MALDWRALQLRLDNLVDGRWADPIILIPWVKGSGVYLAGEEGPDPARQMRVTEGALMTPGAKLVGESGRATGGSGGGFNTQVLEAEVWLSITVENLGSNWKTYWRSYDRVYAPHYGELFNISYMEPSATYRPNIHLIRIHDTLTGIGNPLNNVASPGQGKLFFDTEMLVFYRAGADATAWTRIA